jgi:hypothetical protein
MEAQMTKRKGPERPADALMTAGEARELLSVGRQKMAQMLADGTLPYELDPLDKRIRLLKRADVEALAARSKRNAAA